MLNAITEKKLTRVGLFDTVADAEQAVQKLRAANFSKEEVGVLCSVQSLQSFFPGLAKPHLAKVHSTQTILLGALAGGILGAVALAVAAATQGLGVLAAGAILVGGGALAGVFAGAIYGIEKAKGDYYDRALEQSKILVAVDLKDSDDPARLEKANQLLAEAGAAEVDAVGGYP